MDDFTQTNWWRYMEEPMKDLAGQTFRLLEREEQRVAEIGKEEHDYAFVVFPLAKAYEGFLKKVFLDMGLISKQQYIGERFRLGKALNPNLPKRYRFGWIYGRLVSSCGGDAMPMYLWETWKHARNKIFHFFPNHLEFITLSEAKELVMELRLAMERAIEGCKVG